jgi:hypothetical protein
VTPFYWQWWRLALSRNRGGTITFCAGERWEHVALGIFICVARGSP